MSPSHEPTGGPVTAVATPGSPAQEHAERRCWRCLQMFPCEPDEIAAVAQWWLCEPCQDALIGHSSKSG